MTTRAGLTGREIDGIGEIGIAGSGRYRIELCDSGRAGMAGTTVEYVGFNNKTCGYAVGPRLRSPAVSDRWRTWSVHVLGVNANNANSSKVVTIRNDFSQARCTDRYIAIDDDGDACDSQRVRLRRGRLLPAFIEWTVKSIKNDECFNIVSRDKPVGCSRYLSADADNDRRHLRLAKRDNGSGLQRWRFVRVDTHLDPVGSSCLSTGPSECSRCCRSKFVKGIAETGGVERAGVSRAGAASPSDSDPAGSSFLDDPACVDTKKYPQCAFEIVDRFRLSANGVTILCPDADVGDSGVVSGITYTKRDRAGLLALVGTSNEAELVTSCTTGVTDMSLMFQNAAAFDQDVGSWDTGSVTNMQAMFNGAKAFNRDIGSWEVGKVKSMNFMFNNAGAFNQNIGRWDVRNVTTMSIMFSGAFAFDQDISAWNTGAVTSMNFMFNQAASFNNGGAALDWPNTGAVSDMSSMFAGASAFDQVVANWDVGRVVSMYFMFYNATAFNQDVGSWDVGRVVEMGSMFRDARAFNQDLQEWTVPAGMNCTAFASDATDWLAAYGGSIAGKTPPLSASMIAAGCGA